MLIFSIILYFFSILCTIGTNIGMLRLVKKIDDDCFRAEIKCKEIERPVRLSLKKTLFFYPLHKNIVWSIVNRTIKNLNHENILRFDPSLEEKDKLILISEDICFTLDEYLQRRHDKIHLTEQLIKGIKYLHDMKIAIHPFSKKNIYVNSSGVLKICFFDKSMNNMSSFVNANTESNKLNGINHYGEKEFVDQIWSLGCILTEIFCHVYCFRKILIEDENFRDLQHQINTERNTERIPDDSLINTINLKIRKLISEKIINKDIIELIMTCLDFVPNARPRAAELLKHFQELKTTNRLMNIN